MSIAFDGIGIDIVTSPITMIKLSCGCIYNEDGHGVVQEGDAVECPDGTCCDGTDNQGRASVVSFIEIEKMA